MQTRVQRWGNSLALRIPKPFAEEVDIEADTPVELTLSEGRLIVTPLRPVARRRPRKRLGDLLLSVTDENRHEEADFGAPAGDEAL